MFSLEDDLSWTALDYASEDPVRKTFKVSFNSRDIINDFKDTFAQGKVSFFEVFGFSSVLQNLCLIKLNGVTLCPEDILGNSTMAGFTFRFTLLI